MIADMLSSLISAAVKIVIFGSPVYFFFKYGLAFFKALPFAVYDIFINIKNMKKGESKPFDLYGVYLYNGLGGNGKTLSMVRRARELKKKYPKLKVIANFHTAVADEYFDKWEDILNCTNIDEHGVNQGVLILFDEIHLTLNSQGWKNAPDELLEYISLQRHLHKCIFGSAQEWSRVSKIIREQVNWIVDCKCLFRGRYCQNKVYTKENYLINGDQKSSGLRKRPVVYKVSFVGTDKLRSLYDTDEIVKGLKLESQSSEDKIASRLMKALTEQANGL